MSFRQTICQLVCEPRIVASVTEQFELIRIIFVRKAELAGFCRPPHMALFNLFQAAQVVRAKNEPVQWLAVLVSNMEKEAT